MPQAISRRLFAFCLLVIMLTACAHAQDYKPLLGTWSMTSESTGDPVSWKLTLKENEGKLVATVSIADGEKAARNVTFANGVLKFEAPYQDAYFDIELKAVADKLDGTWDGDGDSGKTYGTKN